MKNNIFNNFLWEKDGNGNYLITDKRTLLSLVAIPRLDKKDKYCIENSTEIELNFYNQKVPKKYNKFEIMDMLENANGSEIWIVGKC